MTTTEPTTGERVVVVPEITVSVRSKESRARALALVKELRPKLGELRSLALEVRADNDAALVALYPVLGTNDGHFTDEMYDLARNVTGWDDVWRACSRISDLCDIDTVGLENHEIARGGERDFPRGTVATVKRSSGKQEPLRVEVVETPRHPLAEGGYLVRDLESGKTYGCTHDDIKEGLESVPEGAGQ